MEIIKKLQDEFEAAVHAIYGDQIDELEKELAKHPEKTLADLIDPQDLLAVFRKMEWYIYDESLISKLKKENQELVQDKELYKNLYHMSSDLKHNNSNLKSPKPKTR